MRGRTCAGTFVTGTGKDGSPRATYLYHVADNERCMREYGHQAVVLQTALNPVVALELLAEGVWSGAGVLGPEAFDAVPFLDLLADYGEPHAVEERTPARVILVVAATERELGGLPRLVCGVGPVEAAAATARRSRRQPPAAVLHVGIAGCRRGVRARAAHARGRVRGGLRRRRDPLAPRRASPDPRLVEAARRVLPHAPVLPIGTSGTVGGTRGHDVEAMEGFGVLRACELAGVPAVEVRAIANEIEEEDRGRWRFDEAFAALAQALPALVGLDAPPRCRPRRSRGRSPRPSPRAAPRRPEVDPGAGRLDGERDVLAPRRQPERRRVVALEHQRRLRCA